MTRDEALEYAQGLIDLGAFLLDRPDLLVDRYSSVDPVTLNLYCISPEELGARLRALGAGQKYSEASEYSSSTGVRREFGPHSVDVYASSEKVCAPSRRETRQVPVVELTDEAKAEIEVAKAVIDAVKARHTRMEAREVVTEWSCPPSLLALAVSETPSVYNEEGPL